MLVTDDERVVLVGGLGVSSDPTFWIEARASGMLAFVLLTVSVMAGLVLKSRPFGTALKPATVTDTHRFLALLVPRRDRDPRRCARTRLHRPHRHRRTCSFPGFVPYRPLWVGVGVVAAELMVLVYASFSQRKRIGAKNWRRLHWATYGDLRRHGRARGHVRHGYDPAVGARDVRRARSAPS